MLDTQLPPTDHQPHQRRFFRELETTEQAVSNITPNWFAAVMGTGIVANAAVTLPVTIPGLLPVATVVWILASILLIVLVGATIAHWVRYRATARSHIHNPVMAHFYGAPAMAFLTIGSGTLQLGSAVIGQQAAVDIDAVLWVLGTGLGLVSAVLVPYLTFTRYDIKDDSAFAGWLMPVVPPMVSAASGALLIPYLPAGQWRASMLWACYAMFGISLIASLIIISQVWSRLAHHKIGAAAMVPTLWIVLGPLGQSITAANLLGGNAHFAVDERTASIMGVFGVLYGVPVLGFALLWMAIVIAITIRTARRGMPFSLTWWSFTFPVGTCVTGVNGLALHTGLAAFSVLAVLLYLGLVLAWAIVAIRTFRGAIVRGTLLAPPASS